MTPERVQPRGSVGRLTALVDAYARRIYRPVLTQHEGAMVASPLGVWLLLAACAGAADGDELASLEETLGCSSDEAGRLLADFMGAPPPALKAAIAVWVAAGDATDALAAWVRSLPKRVQSGFMPTQAEADAWAQRETLGLIKSFPVDIDEFTRVVLASALATRVSWERAFGVAPADEQLGPGSPWRGRVDRVLWDPQPRAGGSTMIARTESAGLVAVHFAVAKEDLTVISVSADPSVARDAVLAAAHEVASVACDDCGRLACSLWDLPLGPGHSWEVSEREVPAYLKETQLEWITAAAMPAWRVTADTDLTASALFGTGPALDALRGLIGPKPDDQCAALQTAVAAFTRYGFEAAAVTAFAVRASAALPASQRVTERTAVLRFDHPYGAVAIAGRPSSPGSGAPASSSPFAGLALFSAWVNDPLEPEDDPPSA